MQPQIFASLILQQDSFKRRGPKRQRSHLNESNDHFEWGLPPGAGSIELLHVQEHEDT